MLRTSRVLFWVIAHAHKFCKNYITKLDMHLFACIIYFILDSCSHIILYYVYVYTTSSLDTINYVYSTQR